LPKVWPSIESENEQRVGIIRMLFGELRLLHGDGPPWAEFTRNL